MRKKRVGGGSKYELKNFACDTHLKFTKGKRIQLKILGEGGKEIKLQ